MIKTIKQYREDECISTAELAVKFDVDNTCVWRMEKKGGIIIDDFIEETPVLIMTSSKHKINKSK